MTAAHGDTTDTGMRKALIGACRELARRGLSYGTSGNIGLRRDGRHFFVSPTGMAYESLEAEDIPLVDFAGRWFGRRRPSAGLVAIAGDVPLRCRLCGPVRPLGAAVPSPAH